MVSSCDPDLDSMVLRDRDSSGDGTVTSTDERLYVLHSPDPSPDISIANEVIGGQFDLVFCSIVACRRSSIRQSPKLADTD
jgi:hypothetical protein